MKSFLLLPALLLTGFAVGGGSAYAVRVLLPPSPPDQTAKREELQTVFTPAGKILAPLVFADGALSGYVQIEIQLETSEPDVAFVTPRLPLLMNAINMRTFRTPMASGPGGTIPELSVFRKLVLEASNEAFGPGIVHRVVVMQATPA